MVSLRRRKNLGLCSGTRSWFGIISFPVEHPRSNENDNAVKIPGQNNKPSSMHPMPSYSLNHQKPVFSEAFPGSSNISGFSTSKGEPNHHFQGKQIKHRKRRRRKYYKDQERCSMRGVYFKNMKWRAAIKVEQKQVHLGTVGSQEEAARLYDRAAFVCGRTTNFKLSEKEKQELSRYKWDEFLAMIRSAMTNKEFQRKHKKPVTLLQSDDWESECTGPSSVPNDGGTDTSVQQSL